jgi:hypothetical protein
MGVWHGHAGGAVILSNCRGVLSDPIEVLAGKLPAIRENRSLAKNILKFLGHARRQDVGPSPGNLCDRIEINLVDAVLETLKLNLGVRQKCAARQEEERNKLQRECYLDLIDLKKIMSKQWKLFDPIFAAAKTSKIGKEKNLEFMDEQNRLRRLVAHPVKAHLSDREFTAEEIAFIKQTDALALTLATIVRTFRASASG